MELVNAVLGPIIDITVGPVGRQIGYVYRYAENIQYLRQKVEDLSSAIVEIEEKIEGARTVGDIIRPEASDWQVKATRAKVDADNFLNERVSDGHERCFKGFCPNIWSRYVLSKDAKKKTTDVVQLVEHGNMFHTVSRPAPLPSYDSRIGNPYFEAFESRKSAFEDIMHSLEDEAVQVIGIYGMGGVGKTAMADKVGAQAENDRIFDDIVKVVVTQNPIVGKIQDELAAQLNLKLNETTEVGKAIQLLKRLTNGKKILLILDDVWKELDLSGIGIPFAKEKTNGCKIVLTTRSESVCQEMKVNKKIPIGFLSGEEAWILFRRQMENDIPHDLHEVAKQVCKECAGLPIAILVIGRILNGKPNCFVWNDVLEQLRQSQLKDIPGVSKKVYASLAVSYHNLDSDDAKSCFLFCSLFPEDFNIPTEYILRYGKGVGVPKEMKTLSSKRDRVHHLVHYLKSHCLLLEGRDEVHVKMHDVVRDVAISIASEEGQHVFLSASLDQFPDKFDCAKLNTLMLSSGKFPGWPFQRELPPTSASLDEFPDKFDCAILNTVMLSLGKFHGWPFQRELPPTFFRGMMKLKVLILKRMSIPEFPASIRSLVDMEVLCLEACDLGDLSWIGNLKKLDMLILQDSNFNLLPAEIGELSHLRLLDLRDCTRLKSISPGVISSLSRLQELFLPMTGNLDDRGLQSNLAELEALSQLETLEMFVPQNLMELPQHFGSSFWAKLAKFRIFINIIIFERHEDLSSKNILKLNGVSWSGWAAMLSKRVERLYVNELNASENLKVLYDVDRGSFPKLQHFKAVDCQGITEFLSMVIDERSVSHLSVMRICRCNLEYILSPSMAKVLPQLQSLEIMSCENLKSIVGGCQENDNEDIVIFHQLEKLYLERLPMLVSFYTDSREGCAVQPLFTRKVGLPKLSELFLRSVDRVKEIWAGDFPPPPNSSLCKLHIMDCHELVRAIPPAILPSLYQLESLDIQSCNSLREIVGGCQENGTEDVVIFHQLEEFNLKKLPMLRSFYPDSREGCALQPLFTRKVGLPKLRKLRLEWVDHVKEIWAGDIPPPPNSSIPPAILPSLHRLESLIIEGCDSLREIVGSEAALGGGVASSGLPKLREIRLVDLRKLEYVLSPSMAKALPQLQTLEVKDCENLKSIVGGCQENDTEDVVIFHQLEELYLTNLPMLVSFYPDSREGCALFTRKVGLPKLRKLRLQRVNHVKEIWAGNIPPPPDSSLCNLTQFEILECRELVRAIPPAILPSLHRLESLDIQFCDSLREIVGSEAALGGVASSGLPKLREILLEDLPKLEKIFSVPSLTCQCLSFIQIRKCGRLINLFSSPFTAHAFAPDLQELEIRECEKLEEIVSVGSTGKDVVLGDHAASSQIIFPCLKRLGLRSLPNLTSLCPSGYLLFCESSLKSKYYEAGYLRNTFELNNSMFTLKKSVDNY